MWAGGDNSVVTLSSFFLTSLQMLLKAKRIAKKHKENNPFEEHISGRNENRDFLSLEFRFLILSQFISSCAKSPGGGGFLYSASPRLFFPFTFNLRD